MQDCVSYPIETPENRGETRKRLLTANQKSREIGHA